MNPFTWILNRFGKWWDISDLTYDDDVAYIRREAPLRGLILDAEEPTVISPGVFMFNAYDRKTKRMGRFHAYVLRGIVCFEKHG